MKSDFEASLVYLCAKFQVSQGYSVKPQLQQNKTTRTRTTEIKHRANTAEVTLKK